jgi:hypothetical protein
MRNIFASLLSVHLLVPMASLSAQAPLPLELGARVRITAPDCGFEKQAATFEALGGGMLVLGATNCPLASVARLELHAGRKVSAARALGFPVVGLLVGGVAGGLVGYSTCAPCDYELEGLAPAVGAVLGGGVGFVAGLVVGLLPRDRWQTVPLEPLRVTPIASARGRFGLAASVRF